MSAASIYRREASFDENLAHIREWIATKLEVICGHAMKADDYDAPFSVFDIDSVDAVSLLADLEQVVPVPVPQTLLLDRETINQVAQYLVEECSRAASPA